jgi:hypothetical protein
MAFSLEDWLEEQAQQNPQYMRRPPDMAFTVDEAENAPDMTIGLDEAKRGPAPFKPDMSFAPQWIETREPGSYMSFLPEQTEPQPFKPDMTISLEEAERNRMPQPSAASAAPPMRGSLSSLIAPRDAEMDSRWRAAEQNALDRSGYAGNQSYGVGEAVRDFAPLAIGGTLDVLLNKGRGLGYLSGAAMQANAQTAATRQKEAAAAGDFAQAARQQREGGQRAQLGYATEQRQQEQFDLMNNPDHPAAELQRQKLIKMGVPEEMVSGQPLRVLQANQSAYTPYFKHATADLTTGDQAERAGAITRARLGAEDEHFPTALAQATQQAGQTAAAAAGARADIAHSDAPRALEDEVTRKRRLEEEGLGTGNGYAGHLTAEDVIKANPGLDFGDPKYLQDALRTRALTKDVIGQIQAANRGAGVIDELYKSAMEAREAAKRGDVSGTLAARRQYQSHVEEYAGILGKISGSNSLEQQRRAIDLAPDPFNPAALDIIKSLWPSIAVNVKGNLGTYHITARAPAIIGGETPAATQSQPSAANSSYNPVTNGLVNPSNPLQAVDTGGRRDVQPIPQQPPQQQAGGEAREYTVRKQGQPALRKTLTPAQVQALIQAQVEVVPVR